MSPQSPDRCWVEIDLDALRGNVDAIRRRIGPSTKLMAVVKANAYGHGLAEVGESLGRHGVDAFAVANSAEALALRKICGRKFPILQFGSALPFEIEGMIEHNITPTLSTLEEAQQFESAAAAHRRRIPVHVEIDTGMGRSGFWHEGSAAAIHQIAALPHLHVEGVYTHFPSADENAGETRRHLDLFLQTANQLNPKPLLHASNSAATLTLPEARLDMVRTGLLLYGVCPPGTICEEARPVLSFKSRVTFVKSVAAGRTISYGQTFVAPHAMTIATVGAGYADGVSRHLSNKGKVLVGGQRCQVLGRVTMDQIMVDVTGLPKVSAGDEVVFIGSQNGATITASEVAEWSGSIAWAILCGINQTARVHRHYR